MYVCFSIAVSGTVMLSGPLAPGIDSVCLNLNSLLKCVLIFQYQLVTALMFELEVLFSKGFRFPCPTVFLAQCSD